MLWPIFTQIEDFKWFYGGKLARKKELNNRFGLVLVKSLKSSAETKASSKPLGSAEIETETEGSVVH